MIAKVKEKTVSEQLGEGLLTTGSFTIQAQMPQGKSITMSGYIYSTSSTEAINKQVDLFSDVIDRARTKAEIPELEVKLQQRFVALEQQLSHIEMLQSKSKDGAKKLATNEAKMLENLLVSVKAIKKDIEKGKEEIEAAKLKVA
jgi:hypothetical protein